MCMRTNIELNEHLLQEARRFTKARTKKDIVEEALRTFVEVKTLEWRKQTYRERLQTLESKLGRLTLRQSPSQLLREDRDRR